MQQKQYYTEVLDSIPFHMMVELMKRVLPAPVALGVAGFFRLKHVLGFPSKPQYAFGDVSTQSRLPKHEIPGRVLARWAGKMERLHDLGFQECAFAIPDMIGAKESAGALFIDEPGSTLATLEYHRMVGAQGIEEQTPLEFNSFLIDGSEIMTAMLAEEHLVLANAFPLDFVDQEYLPNTDSIRKVYAHHCERIRQQSERVIPRELAASEQLACNQRRFEAMLSKGVIRKISPREVASVREKQLPLHD